GTRLIYTPPANYTGFDSIRVTYDGAYTFSAGIDVNLEVAPHQGDGSGGDTGGDTTSNPPPSGGNTAPVLHNDSYTVGYFSQETKLDVLANDDFGSDYQGPKQITHISFTNLGSSVLSQDGQSIYFTPNYNVPGVDTFPYTVDGQYTATVTITVG